MKRIVLAALVAAAVLAVPTMASASSHYCGQSATGWAMTAGSSTSCAFTRSTYRAVRSYQRWNGSLAYGERFHVDAWSPVTRRWYGMRCQVSYWSPSIVCRGGNGARVTFRY